MAYTDDADSLWEELQKRQKENTADSLFNEVRSRSGGGNTAESLWAELSGPVAQTEEVPRPALAEPSPLSILDRAEAAGAEPGSGYYQLAKAADLIVNPEEHATWLTSPEAEKRYYEGINKMVDASAGEAMFPAQKRLERKKYPDYPYAEYVGGRQKQVDEYDKYRKSWVEMAANDLAGWAADFVAHQFGKVAALGEGGAKVRAKTNELLKGTILEKKKPFRDIPLEEGEASASITKDPSFAKNLQYDMMKYAYEWHKMGFPESKIKQWIGDFVTIAAELGPLKATGGLFGAANLPIHAYFGALGEGASKKEARTAATRAAAFQVVLDGVKIKLGNRARSGQIKGLEKKLSELKKEASGTPVGRAKELEKKFLDVLDEAQKVKLGKLPESVEKWGVTAPAFAVAGTTTRALSGEEITLGTILGEYLMGGVLPGKQRLKERLGRIKTGATLEGGYQGERYQRNEAINEEAARNIARLTKTIREAKFSEEFTKEAEAKLSDILGENEAVMAHGADRGKGHSNEELARMLDSAAGYSIVSENLNDGRGGVVEIFGKSPDLLKRPLRPGEIFVERRADGTIIEHSRYGSTKMTTDFAGEILNRDIGPAKPAPEAPERVDVLVEPGTRSEFEQFMKDVPASKKITEVERFGLSTTEELSKTSGLMAGDLDANLRVARKKYIGEPEKFRGEKPAVGMKVGQEKLELKTQEEISEASKRVEQRMRLIAEGKDPERFMELNENYEPGSQVYRDWVDNMDEARRITKHLVKSGVKVPEESNTYLAAVLSRGSSRIADMWLKRGIERDGVKVAMGPVEIVDNFAPQSKFKGKAFKNNMDRFLVHTRNLMDLQRRPSGAKESAENIATELEVAEARKWLSEMQTNHPQEYALMEKAAAEYHKFGRELLNEMVRGNLISAQEAENIWEKNNHYVPYWRLFPAGVDMDVLKKLSKNGVISNDDVRKIGDMKNVDKQLDTLYEMRESGQLSSEQYDSAIVSGDFPMFNGNQKPLSGSVLKKIKGGTRMGVRSPIETLVGKTHQIVSAIEKNKLKLALADWSDVLPDAVRRIGTKINEAGIPRVMRPEPGVEPMGKVERGSRYEMVASREGIGEIYSVSKAVADALNTTPPAHRNALWRFMTAARNIVRTSATVVPEFWLRNATRDTLGSFIQVSVPPTEYGGSKKKVRVVPIVDPVRAMFDVIGGRVGYEEYQLSGAALSGMVNSYSETAKSFKELRNPYGKTKAIRALQRTGGAVIHPIKSLEKVSSLFETATRLGVYKRARKAGYSPRVSGAISRESSVDFARMGLRGRSANQAIAFLNAGIQGTDRAARAFNDNPLATMMRVFSAVVIPEIIQYQLNKGNKKYDEYADWMRNVFWLIPIGDGSQHIKIPKPFVYSLFGAMVRRGLKYKENTDPEAIHGFLNDIIESTSPVGGAGMEGILPSAIKPFIENMVNYNFFLQRPIVSPYGVDKMKSNQYHKYTARSLIAICKYLNISPAKAENILRGYFTSLADWGLRLSDSVYKKITNDAYGRPKDLGTMPFTRGFFTRTGIELSKTQSMYYDSLKRVKELYDDVKTKEFKPENSGEIVGIHRVYQRVNRALSALSRDETKIIESNKSGEEKFDELEKIALQKEELFMIALKQFKRKPQFWVVPPTIRDFL